MSRWFIVRQVRTSVVAVVTVLVAALLLPTGAGGPAPAEAVPPSEREEISLNGDMWQFRPVQTPFFGWEEDDTGLDRSFIRDAVNAIPDEDWETWADVRVPMAWNSIGEFDFPDYYHYLHKGEYRRTFDVPPAYAGKRVTLDFAGVNWRAWVYVNDTLVHAEGFEDRDFTHEFALTPFEVDITDLVRPGSTGNTLRVVVQDVTANFVGPSPAEPSEITYPIGVRGEYWNRANRPEARQYHDMKSGIFGDVSLSAVPKVYVEDVFVRPDQDTDTLTVEVTVRNESSSSRLVTIGNTVETWADGAEVLTFDSRRPTRLVRPGRTTVVIEQSWDDYELWWPDDPVLYDLVTTLTVGHATVDEAVNRFGVRDVHAVSSDDPDERGVYVNGVRTALFGESIETNILGKGLAGLAGDGLTFNGNWALTRSYFSHVIDVAKSMNINVLRLHRGWAMNKELVEVADEKGMMLIAENPIVTPAWEGELQDREVGLSKVLEIAAEYRNHPSIVMWSISNESPIYNRELTDGMQTGYAGRPPVNPDIQLISANNSTDTVTSAGYRGGYLVESTPKTWFTYEENASYTKLTDDARRGSVIDSMRIFRQQRMSLGYDAKIALAFYNFQKVFSLPDAEHEQVEIPWTQDEIEGPGYHAKYMWRSIMNPYADPPTTNWMPQYTPSPEELWADSYAPVAVFDKGWVDNAMTSGDLTTSYSAGRELYLFNSDLRDRSTEVTVDWSLVNDDTGEEVRSGTFTEDVPLGGYVSHYLVTGSVTSKNFSLRLTASKSGEVRFEETLTFGGDQGPPPEPEGPGDDVIVIDNGDAGTATSGLGTSMELEGRYGKDVDITTAVQPDDFARYIFYTGSSGDYRILVNVPAGLSGTQKARVTWEDEGLQQIDAMIDLGTPGWVEIPGGPFSMTASQSANAVEFIAGGTSTALVADAVALQKVQPETTTHAIDQSVTPAGGTTWEYLGRYECPAGQACHVSLTNDTNGRVVADAVQFRQGDTVVTVDEDAATTTGTWSRATNPRYHGGDIFYADKASPATATATWTPDLPGGGAWDVYLTWDNNPDNNGAGRGTDVPVTVTTSPPAALE